MGYVEKQLSEGERIVFETTLHPITFWRVAVPLLLLAVYLSFVDLTIGIVSAFGAIIFSLVPWITYKTSEFAVTDKRLSSRRGSYRGRRSRPS